MKSMRSNKEKRNCFDHKNEEMLGKSVAAWLFYNLLCVFFSLLSRFEFLFLRMRLLFNWDVGFSLFLFHPFLQTMLLSKSLISRFFLESNQFWFQENDRKNIDWLQKEMVGKMHKVILLLLTPFTWNQIFL